MFDVWDLAWVLMAVQAGATWWMVGLVWFVQRVHYPMIAGLARGVLADKAGADGGGPTVRDRGLLGGGDDGRGGFCAAEREHMRRTGPVTGPIMLVELGAAVGVMVWSPVGVGAAWWVCAWVGLGLLAVVWGSTVLLQIPLHQRLCEAADAGAAERLVGTNWVRTAAWSGRGVLVLGMLVLAARVGGG